MFPAVIALIRQQKIAADMTLMMPFPVATQWKIKPLTKSIPEEEERLEDFCSPWVGLCAGFGVCRSLALTRPILAMGTEEVRNLSWYWGGNRIDGGAYPKFCLTCEVEFPIL